MGKVGIVGVGNMGEALVRGWLEAGIVSQQNVLALDKNAERLEEISGIYGVKVAPSISMLSQEVEMVVLAVKPQDAMEVLDGISGQVSESQTVISIIAGLTIEKIRQKLGEAPFIIRVMPNMGALVRASISAYAVSRGRGKQNMEFAIALLEAVGEVLEVPEERMDLVTAVSGSGPAYYSLMADALARAAEGEGLEGKIAYKLSTETLWGCAKLIKSAGKKPAQLIESVSSPGGTTEAALAYFEKAGFSEMLAGAVRAARERSSSLSD
ncbi:MAG: pyrroline-5-carboxylate reductase [Actinomycetota bacterium]|nr:pyrroline-5-carboxylate reductase [Actinomycetota bacterium]